MDLSRKLPYCLPIAARPDNRKDPLVSSFRDLIARMAVDAEFARYARANPDVVSVQYGLSPDEQDKLRGLADASATAGPQALGARLSKSGIGTGGLMSLLEPGDLGAGHDVPAQDSFSHGHSNHTDDGFSFFDAPSFDPAGGDDAGGGLLLPGG